MICGTKQIKNPLHDHCISHMAFESSVIKTSTPMCNMKQGLCSMELVYKHNQLIKDVDYRSYVSNQIRVKGEK